MNKNVRRIAIGTAIFGALGYVAGVMTAPKSGKESRKNLRKNADKTMIEAERQLKRLHSDLNRAISDFDIDDIKDTVRDKKSRDALVGEVVSQADRARQKTREILSAIHDGNANDRDLKHALKDGSKALDSLKKYLQK